MVVFLLSVTGWCVSAQSPTAVTGTVTDDSGEPLIGVSVKLKDGDAATVTNLDGQ